MPTSLEFDHAAALYDRVAADIALVLGPPTVLLGVETVSGGMLGLVVDATIDAATANVATCIRDFQDSAALCRQRAEACREFAAEMATYHKALDQWSTDIPPDRLRLDTRPTRPTKPASWVEV